MLDDHGINLSVVEADNAYEIYYGEGNPSNIKKLYILAIFDDYWVAYKYWHRRRWIYKIEFIYRFQLLDESGELKRK
jgi:hypothetical protein